MNVSLTRFLGVLHRAFASGADSDGEDMGKGGEEVIVAKGTGGTIELRGNRLRLTRGGLFGFIVTVLGIEGGHVERTIRVSTISSVEIDKPALFFRYIRFSYPGAPQLTGHDTRDMMAENAMLMSLLDNRQFYRIKERIEEMMDESRR
ncbi:MAG: hypothetical protein ABT940_14185 [Alphaproteobacteria bacterium]